MSIDLATLRAKLAALKNGPRSMDQKFLSIPDYDSSMEDRSIIRILPGPKDNPDKFYSETLIHKINEKNIQSPRAQDKKAPCPINDYIRALWKSEKEENIAIARQIKGSKRYYFNVIVRERVVVNQETGKEEVRKNDGPLIFSCGIKLFEKIIETIVDPEYENFLDLKEGYDFKVKKVTVGDYPNYDKSIPCRKPSVAGTNEEIERWMSNLHCLDDLVKPASYEERLAELNTFRGVSLTKDEDKQEETKVETENSQETEDDGNEDFLEQLKRIQQKAK